MSEGRHARRNERSGIVTVPFEGRIHRKVYFRPPSPRRQYAGHGFHTPQIYPEASECSPDSRCAFDTLE